MYSFFERLINPFPSEEPLTPPKTLFKFCRHYARGCERYIILMAIFAGLLAIADLVLYAFMGKLVDWLAAYTPQELFATKGGNLILMAAMVAFVLPVLAFIRSLLIHQTLLGNFPMAIRWQVHRFLLGQSLAFYQNEFAGRLATKLMQTSLAVRETVLKLMDVMVYVSIYFGALLVLVASLEWRLALPFLVWLFAYICLLRYFLPKLSRISTKQADARSEMTGRLVDTYTNMMTVKLFSHSSRESDYARESMNDFLGTVHPQMRLVTKLDISVWVCNYLLILSATSLSLWLWTQGEISAGSVAVAVSLNFRLFGMSQWVMWEVSALFENIGTVRDGMNTLSLPREVQDKPDAKELVLNHQKGIELDQVCFHYGASSGVIEDFSLRIRPGEKIGLVGRSGAGKSTLVNLLLRFYELESGKITIDEQNIADLTQRSLRANIGMVTQDTSLLHRSIRDNLLYSKPGASEEAMIEAAKQAQAHEFILTLTDSKGRRGYDAHVGERGVKLSGGQRQRIAIARVLLKNAPILILDEATSALDSEAEQAIQENLNLLMENKTVIAIAHRLSTIAALDRLIVLDQGKIVEEGTHAELIAKKGIYASLWAHQSGGFL